MAAPREENPIRNKPYVQSYDAGDNAFPILAVKYEPKAAGYILPAAYAHFTDIKDLTKYPNHVFVGSTPLMDSDQRVEHIYMILPGPWLYSFKIQERSGDVWIGKKRKNIAGNIIPNVVIAPSIPAPGTWAANYAYNEGDMLFVGSTNLEYVCYKAGTSGSSAPAWGTAIYGTLTDNTVTWMTIPNTAHPIIATEREDITDKLSWEVVTRIPTSQFATEDTALVSYRSMAYAFPQWLYTLFAGETFSWVQTCFTDGSSAQIINAKVSTWWVISATAPFVSVDQIITDTLLIGSGENRHILHDAISNGFFYDPLLPAPPTRANSTVYALYDVVQPAPPNGFVYVCTTPGTSASSSPAFNTAAGSTTTDGFVIWTRGAPSNPLFTQVLPFYSFGFVPLNKAATTPSKTDYITNWIGNYKKIEFDATPEQFGLLWRCEKIEVIMR